MDYTVAISNHVNVGSSIIPAFLREHGRFVDLLFPMWFDITDIGEIKARDGCEAPYTKYKEFCEDENITLMPIIRNFNPKTFLSDTTAQAHAIQGIITLVNQEGFDGILLDIEHLERSMQTAHLNLVKTLYEQLKAKGKKLVVTVNALTFYKELAEYADFLYIFFYDYTGPWNKTRIGSTAPLKEKSQSNDIVRDCEKILGSGIDPEKILMGVAFYGNDFTKEPLGGAKNARTLYWSEIEDLRVQYDAETRLFTQVGSAMFPYTDEQGEQHEVWFEDAYAFWKKMTFMKQKDLGGFAAWALTKNTYPDPQVWEQIKKIKGYEKNENA